VRSELRGIARCAPRHTQETIPMARSEEKSHGIPRTRTNFPCHKKRHTKKEPWGDDVLLCTLPRGVVVIGGAASHARLAVFATIIAGSLARGARGRL